MHTTFENMSKCLFRVYGIHFLTWLQLFSTTDFSPTWIQNKLMLTSLRIENCNISYDDIKYLAARISLVALESVIGDADFRIQPAVFDTDLFGLAELRIIFTSNVRQKIEIEKLLPTQGQMTSVTVLVLHCVKDTEAPESCLPGQITYDSTDLQHRFPQLQSLAIQYVYPQKISAKLMFPWDPEPYPLPHGLHSSNYYQHLSYHTKHEHRNNLTRRVLSITNISNFDIDSVCDSSGSLNELVLRSNNISSIPSGCFQSLKDLYYLDLSWNPYKQLPKDLFRGLVDLEKLYIRHTNLESLEPGTFDDLGNLDILSIDYHNITFLPPGIFANLSKLRVLSMHNGSLENISHSDQQGHNGSLPVGSWRMVTVDFRWNKLTEFVYDCYKFPSLMICDLGHNYISLEYISRLFDAVDPVFLGLAKPLAIHGEPADILLSNNFHEILQTKISLQDNNITKLGFFDMWGK